jgi:hypothetical protein
MVTLFMKLRTRLYDGIRFSDVTESYFGSRDQVFDRGKTKDLTVSSFAAIWEKKQKVRVKV